MFRPVGAGEDLLLIVVGDQGEQGSFAAETRAAGLNPMAIGLVEVPGDHGRIVETTAADLGIGHAPEALGLHLPLASGQAHAQKLAGPGRMTAALFGEGLTSTAMFHETVALAVACDLPLVLVCKSQLWPEGAPAEFRKLELTPLAK